MGPRLRRIFLAVPPAALLVASVPFVESNATNNVHSLLDVSSASRESTETRIPSVLSQSSLDSPGNPSSSSSELSTKPRSSKETPLGSPLSSIFAQPQNHDERQSGAPHETQKISLSHSSTFPPLARLSLPFFTVAASESAHAPAPDGSSIGGVPVDTDSAGTPVAASNQHTARWRVFTDQGREMFSQGRMREAERYFERALEEAKLGFGEEDAHVASACNNLAELYRVLGRFQEAEPLYLRASDLLKAAAKRAEQSSDNETQNPNPVPPFSPGHVPLYSDPQLAAAAASAASPSHTGLGAGAAFALHNLGGLYLRQGNLEKAEERYKEALEIKRHTLGESHPEYANTLFHLAEVYRVWGKVDEARALLQRSISILEESEGGDVQRIARRTMRLAQILMRSQAWEEAEALQRRALHLVESSAQLGPQSQAAAVLLEGVAQCLVQQTKRNSTVNSDSLQDKKGRESAAEKRLKEAQELMQRCFEIRHTGLGKSHVAVGLTLTRLAEVLLTRAQFLAQGEGRREGKGEREGEGGGGRKEVIDQILEDAQIAVIKAHNIAEGEWSLVLQRRARRPPSMAPAESAALDDKEGALEDKAGAGSTSGHGRQRALSSEWMPLLCLVRSLELQAKLILETADGDETAAMDEASRILQRVESIAHQERAIVNAIPDLRSAVNSCSVLLNSIGIPRKE